jgi:ABC-type multidrug transport system permease subunit
VVNRTEPNVKTLVMSGLIAGGLSGGTLGFLHYALRAINPDGNHPVVNYTIGSTSCLTALSAVTLALKGRKGLGWVLLYLLIWGISGAFTLLAYIADEIVARKGEQAAIETRRYSKNTN